MKGLGYRQRALLTLLQESDRILATGHLGRMAGIEDHNVVIQALHGLVARGLAVHIGHGKWASS